MARTKTIRVSEDELAAIQAFREGRKVAEAPVSETSSVTKSQQAMADAFVDAIERTKPPQKALPGMRRKKTPWSPAEGEPRVKMKRVFYQHGLLLGENVDNETVTLLNQIRPGVYCEGWVRVNLRKDRGIDITYPVRTASQRLKLINNYGIRSFAELLQRIIDEKNNPKKYRRPEDEDLYDLE